MPSKPLKRDFLDENRAGVDRTSMTVYVTAAASNDGGNDDAWRISIYPDQGVECMGRELEYLSFVITGGWEMSSLIDALPEAYRLANDFPAR